MPGQPVVVNRVLIPEGEINLESGMIASGGIETKRAEAARRLAIRELLCQRARALGIDTKDRVDEAIDELLGREVTTPTVDDSACRRYFESNRERFCTPIEAEVRHILVAAAPDDAAARVTARDSAVALIAELRDEIGRFAALAARHSRCPSARDGGRLGVVTRGTTVPELERVLLQLPVGLAHRPIESRYGFHVAEVLARSGGEPLAFEQVRPLIEEYLHERSWRQAVSQYIQVLAGESDIVGVDLRGAPGPLVQ